MESLPALPESVAFLPLFEIKSLPAPASTETLVPLFSRESLPLRANIATLSPVFIMVSLVFVPYTVALLLLLLIFKGVSTILTVDKFAAFFSVTFPSPTVTIISLPLLVVMA